MSGLHLTGCERAGGGYRAGDPRLLNKAEAQERIVELLEAEARYITEIDRLRTENSTLRNAYRWFRAYPEFKPNPDRREEWYRDINAASGLFP